jgi:hypothetical protein
MLTKEALLAAGYNPFTQKNIKEFTNSFYQKRFDDEKGKRYFITIAEYDDRDLPVHFDDFSYSPDTQFNSNGVTFEIEMLTPESVEQMEAFFERMWADMKCDYYEEWE